MAKTYRLCGMDVRIKSHAQARRVTLRVKPPGIVHLVAPTGFNRADIPQLLERHRDWLAQGLEKVRAQQTALLNETPPEQIELQALGQRWHIHYTQRAPGARCIKPLRGSRQLEIGLAAEQEWRSVLRRWLMSQARQQLEPWLSSLADEHGFEYRRVSIRGQRTRWGSCSANGTISLNYRLLFLPPAWVRYLLIHELCHTREMNHSRAFWSLVESCEPNYRRYDRALKSAAEHLPDWLQGI